MSSVSPTSAEIAAFLYSGIPDKPEVILGVQMCKDHCHKLRAILIIDLIGRVLLQKIFSWGAPQKCMLQTLKGYLITVKGMSNGQYRSKFDKTSRDIIDGDPSCSSFDVTLWYAAIQCGCDGLAPLGDNTWHSSPDTLENHLKRIKDIRNEVMHGNVSISEQEFKDKCEELRNLLISTLDKAKDKYSIDLLEVNQIKDGINSSIDYLRDTPLSYMDLPVHGNLFTILHEFVVKDLLKIFDKISHVNPAQMIVGSNIFLEVKSIYSELRICNAERSDSDEVIAHNDLLKYANEKRKSESGVSHIFLIEGDAGAGKSTLIKFLLSDWKSDNTLVKELSHFKCLINVQCRSHDYESFLHLISDQMPTVRACFREDIHMKKWILDQPSLILLDGLDEMNNKSEKLFDDIIKLSNNSNVLILCTSRPHKIENYYCTLSEHIKTTHVKIEGIPESSREMFVRRYHDELIKKGYSKQNTDDLVRFVKSTEAQVMDFLKLPLNLTLLVVMWAHNPAGVHALTTVTELYSSIQELILSRLFQRLLKQGKVTSLKGSEFKRNLRPFVKALGFVALKGLREDVLVLGENDLKDITDVCNSLHLPASEILDAFLIKENTWGATDINTYSCFYHKSNQEYFASRYIYMESKDNPGKSFTHIFEELQITDFRKYQNVVISLIGLHFYFESEDVESVVTELINLLQKSGVNSLSEWIIVLSMTKNNEMVAQQMCRVSPGILEELFWISDGNLSAYMTLLKLHRPNEVTIINIYGKPMELPNFEECLDTLSRYECEVESFNLWYPFYHPADPCVGSSLENKIKQVLKRCRVERYTGSWTSPTSTLFRLFVSVRDGRMFQDLNHYLQSRPTEPPSLSRAIQNEVCVPVDIDPTCLSPLFDELPSLFISDVTENDIEKAAEVARMIQPIDGRRRKKEFFMIEIPGATLKGPHLKELIEVLKTKGVKVTGGLSFPLSSKPSSDEECQEIIELGKKELGCRNDVYWDPDLDL